MYTINKQDKSIVMNNLLYFIFRYVQWTEGEVVQVLFSVQLANLATRHLLNVSALIKSKQNKHKKRC